MNRIAKWAGRAVLGILAVVVLVLAGVYGASEYRIRRTFDIQVAAPAFVTDEATIARGRHVATIRGCTDCHGSDLSGKLFLDEPPIGRLFASNLTRGSGGIGAAYDAADWAAAIRHGVGPDRKPLLFMPSHEFYALSEEDLGALIAYLRSVPAVDNELPASRVGPLGRALFLAGQFPLLPAELIDHASARPQAPEPGVTSEYGAYLATTCTGCHGPGLSGGRIPGVPPHFPAASNLTPDAASGLGTWSEADFFTALREGRRPDGTELDPFMPVQLTAQMTDDEIRAVWLYLRSVPARPYGNR